MLLMQDGILTYTEAMTISADELYRLNYAYALLREEQDKGVDR